MKDATSGAVGTAPDVGQGATDALIALVDVLGREQRLLERLAFTAAQAALLLAAGEGDHLALAADEMNDAERDLGMLELARAMVVVELAEQWDLEHDQPTLTEIHAAAPASFQPALAARHAELRRLNADIAALSATGRDLAEDGIRRITDRLAELEDGNPAGYDSDGAPASPPPAASAGGLA